MKSKIQKHLFALLPLLFCHLAFAGAEFLPAGKDKEEMTKKIVKLIPFASITIDDDYFERMENSLAALRKEFRSFDNWSAAKPAPIRIEIRKNEAQGNSQSLEMPRSEISKWTQDSTDSILRKWVQSAGYGYGSNNWIDHSTRVRQIAVESVKQAIFSSPDSVRGIITALTQVLPASRRAEIFKAADPASQIQLLRRSGITLQMLQQSQFRPEVAGLSASDLTLKNVLEVAETRLEAARKAIQTLFAYLYISQINDQDIHQIGQFSRWNVPIKDALNPERAGSFGSLNSVVFASIFESFEGNEKELKEFRRKLEAVLSIIPRSSFRAQASALKSGVSKPYLTVTEVHPYLGYFRGCTGGDCSTSSSPMFPMSPWEHVFFIQDRDGSFLGYVSATRTRIDGEPTFYLKDIVGAELSGDNAEAILHAFSKVYSYYGAKKYALASPNFTNFNNRFPILKSTLQKYTEDQKAHYLSFPDESVRSFIGNNYDIFGSTYDYDSPATHAEAVLFKSKPFREALYTYDYRPGTLVAFNPETPKESLILALNYLAADQKANLKDLPNIVESEVRTIAELLRNERKTDLKTHYASLTEMLARYGIEMSRAFRNTEERLFAEGHLQASDAMTIEESSLRNDSERIFTNYIRRHGKIDIIANFAHKWQAQLNESKRFGDLISLLTERADARDVVYLLVFADAGIASAQKSLKAEKVAKQIPEAIARFAVGQGIRRSTTTKPSKSLLETRLYKLDAVIQDAGSMSSKKLISSLVKVLSPFGLSQKDLEKGSLKTLLEKTLVKTQDAFAKDNREQSINWIKNNSKEADSAQDIFEVLLQNPVKMKQDRIAISYIEGLGASLNATNVIRLVALDTAGYLDANRILKTDAARKLLVSTALDLAENESTELFGFYKQLRGKKYLQDGSNFFKKFSDLYNQKSFGTLSNLYGFLENLMGLYKMQWSDLLSVPSIFDRVSKIHFSQWNIHDASNQQYFGFTLRFFAERLVNDGNSESTQGLASNLHNAIQLYFQSPEYKSFLRYLIQAKADGCDSCAEFLKQIHRTGSIPILQELDEDTLRMERDLYAPPLVKMLSFLELKRRGLRPTQALQPQLQSSLVRFLSDESTLATLHPDFDLKASILDYLIKDQHPEAFFDSHSLQYFRQATTDAVAFYKSAILTRRLKTPLYFDREDFSTQESRIKRLASAKTAEAIHWKLQFQRVDANPRATVKDYVPEFQISSCKNLLIANTKKK